jgi:hypothetical protein
MKHEPHFVWQQVLAHFEVTIAAWAQGTASPAFIVRVALTWRANGGAADPKVWTVADTVAAMHNLMAAAGPGTAIAAPAKVTDLAAALRAFHAAVEPASVPYRDRVIGPEVFGPRPGGGIEAEAWDMARLLFHARCDRFARVTVPAISIALFRDDWNALRGYTEVAGFRGVRVGKLHLVASASGSYVAGGLRFLESRGLAGVDYRDGEGGLGAARQSGLHALANGYLSSAPWALFGSARSRLFGIAEFVEWALEQTQAAPAATVATTGGHAPWLLVRKEAASALPPYSAAMAGPTADAAWLGLLRSRGVAVANCSESGSGCPAAVHTLVPEEPWVNL